MKKATWIALGVLIALVGVYFVVKDEPVKEVEAPLTIEPVPNLSRIEIVPPDTEDDIARPDLIVFEKDDQAWTLTRPVEAPLADGFARRLDDAFAKPIRTDDFKLSSDKKEEYGLTDDSGVRVSLYAKGSDSAAVELLVGEQIRVPETGAERTYISKVGEDGLYRAQAALGNVLRTPLDDVRSKSIVDVPEDGINSVALTHPDGTKVRLARDAEGWSVERNGEPVSFEVDASRVETALRTFSKLRATGFFDPGETATDELPEADHTVKIDAGTTYEFNVGQTTEDDPSAFVRVGDRPYAYEVSRASYEALTADASYFRTRTPNPIDPDTIERVTFTGESRIVLEKSDDGWSLVRPSSDEFSAARAASVVRTVADLRVHSYPPAGAAAALGDTVGTVTIETADDRHVLTLGEPSRSDDGVELHVAQFDDGPIFYLEKATVDRLTPAVKDLEGAPKPSISPQNMPKGMPKGLPQQIPKNIKLPRGGEER